jgi:hypothetical protein
LHAEQIDGPEIPLEDGDRANVSPGEAVVPYADDLGAADDMSLDRHSQVADEDVVTIPLGVA